MSLKIAHHAEAAEMLRTGSFRALWLRLYRECPWATAAQSPAFVTSWYETYRQEYRPLLVCEFSATNALEGFLPVAVGRSGRAVLPGAHQAEYKSWLALPSNGGAFLESGLKLLSEETDIGGLSFRYLPAGTPVGGMATSDESPWIREVERHSRPIVRLGDAAAVAEYVRRKKTKTIKNSWNRLGRNGSLQLEHIRECEELVPIFDQLIEWYEMRQEMAHGKRPFRTDPYKKTWHLRLLKEGLLHVTLLRAGREIVSALFGLSDGKTFSVLMPVFAPWHAACSPMAIHHLMMVEYLHAEGFSILDLTPGPDPFKERFAAEYEDVNVLAVYFKQREWIKAKVRERTHAITKEVLSAVGIEPRTITRTLPRLRTFRGTLLASFFKAFRRLKRPSRAKLSYD